MNTVFGYILIMVTMLPSGEIESEALDWFTNPYECVEIAHYHHENHDSPYGVGFTCIEDVYQIIEKDLDE
tara:strand:- start:336 stop:545 length:210 start_codon:yes stop_codon:yes gene_type:complete